MVEENFIMFLNKKFEIEANACKISKNFNKIDSKYTDVDGDCKELDDIGI